jgi:invasion protein IalB
MFSVMRCYLTFLLLYFVFLIFLLPRMVLAEATASGGASVPDISGQRFEDRVYRCAGAGSEFPGAASCEIFQSVQVEQGGQRIEVVNLAISAARAGEAGAPSAAQWQLIALAPLDSHLPSGLGLIVGKRKRLTESFRNCNHAGCWVVMPADGAMIDAMKRAAKGEVRFRLLGGQSVSVVFSLSGFTAAFDALSSGILPVPAVEAIGESVAE